MTSTRVMLILKSVSWDFCATTGIRGFSFILKAHNVAEKLFWCLVIAACSCLTIRDVVSTVQTFIDAPTTASFSIIRNTTMDLGKPTICIEVHVDDMDFGTIDLRNVTTVQLFLDNFSGNSNITEYFQAELRRLHHSQIGMRGYTPIINRSDSIVMHISDRDVLPMLSLVTAVSTALVRLENLVTKLKAPEDLTFGIRKLNKQSESEMFSLDKTTSRSVRYAYLYLMKNKVSMPDLIKTIGALMCVIMQIRVISMERNETNGLMYPMEHYACMSRIVTWLGIAPFYDISQELLCYNLDVGKRAFSAQDTNQYSYIHMRPENLFGPVKGLNYIKHFSLDLSEAPVITVDSENIVNVEFESQMEITITLTGHYNQLATKQDPCLPISTFECRFKCRSEHFREFCFCESLSNRLAFTADFTDVRKCEMISSSRAERILDGVETTIEVVHFKNFSDVCLAMKANYHPSKSCKAACYQGCESKIWSFTTSTTNLKGLFDDDKPTLLALSMDPFIFPRIDEILQMDTRSFLAALGGNLSFWLGASFVVLLHVVTFCTRVCFSARRYRDRSLIDHQFYLDDYEASVVTGKIVRKLLSSEQFAHMLKQCAEQGPSDGLNNTNMVEPLHRRKASVVTS